MHALALVLVDIQSVEAVVGSTRQRFVSGEPLGKRLTALGKLGESWKSQICVDREWILRNVIIFEDLLIFDN